MKKNLLSLLLFATMFVSYTPAWSQMGKTKKDAKMMTMSSEDRANQMTDWMKSNFNLNDDQVTKIRDINSRYAQKNQDIYNGTQSRETKMSLIKANETAKEAELKNVLTADQYNMYQSKRGEMKKQFRDDMIENKTKIKETDTKTKEKVK